MEEHRDDVAIRMQFIAERGVPNYFGEQRFGRGGSTLALGHAVIAGKRMSRSKRSLGISALRSFEFNNALAARVEQGTWNALRPGDMANLDGTGSVFEVEAVTPELERRCGEMDIHPAGILPAIESLRVDASWRPLRLRVADLDWDIVDDALWVEFDLPRGSFATSVLREICRCTSHTGFRSDGNLSR
jgi:tRNA pseudouridine13 synthase